MKRSLISQTALTLASMAGNQGLQIAAGIAISRVYGPAGKGLVTYAGIAILAVFAIADGLASGIARQCGDEPSNAPAAHAAALRLIFAVSAVAALPLAALGYAEHAQRALLYVGVAFPFALYVQTMNAFYLIAHRVERTNAASVVINAGSALAMLIATLFVRPSIDVILWIWTAGYFAGAAIIFSGLGGLRAVRAAASNVRASTRLLAAFAGQSSSAGLMTFLAARIDVFIVAALLSPTALGNYTLALALGELMWQIGRSVSWASYGRVATAPLDVAAALTAKVTRIVIGLEVGVALAAFVFGPTLVTFIYGPAFTAAGPALRILLPGMVLYAGDAILTYFLSVKVGWQTVILRVEAVALIVCAVGSLATLSRYGIYGPAIATTFAYLVSFTVKSLLFTRATGLRAADLLVVRPSDFRKSEDSSSRLPPRPPDDAVEFVVRA
jgi:O-antigen/teichoic acid export membrane protein